MRPFVVRTCCDSSGGARCAPARADAARPRVLQNPAQYLAGGTTLLDLMKLDVMRPQTVIDINALDDDRARPHRDDAATACASARWCAWRTRPSTRASCATAR